MSEINFEDTGLLDGTEGPDRAARLQLLQRLLDDGATLEEMSRAVAEDRLALLPLERRLGGRYTAQEIEEQSGLPAVLLLRMRRLVGLPEAGPNDRVFGEVEVQQARSVKLFLDAGFELDVLEELTRVIGEATSRIAMSVTAAFGNTFLQAGDNELDVAERFDDLAEQLTPALSPVLIGTFNAHLRESIHRGMIGALERQAGHIQEATELSVCFADLVGFTRLGGELEVQELGFLANRLASLAGDRAVTPVRLIKTLGDAVMLVSTNTSALIEAALGLVMDAEQAEMPSLRSGIALGEAVQRSGDYFGHSVNLASRVTGVARPGSVLCTEQVRDAAPDDFEWTRAGSFRLKGIHEPVPLYRARELGARPPATSKQRADRR
jgi:adenylate cyclase